ncbi:hypothetical protein DS742_12750 [Lacrimispora amygdalina]|uniref:Uncharacterized protein n=1 Tax=Lacrimispora amygdalina TaxID=253257 RepID=A0A3E2NC01_9FIRM|nr:hypothetical protein DS742_12750 [Clostridium indicum]
MNIYKRKIPEIFLPGFSCCRLCVKMHMQRAAEGKRFSGIFRFFCLIGEKKKLTGTFGCKIRHLFFEM